ncbi:MAG: dTDP-4-dehydrorhamnose 3,5-epimerase [Parcubacteria group bacterium RIFCSPHIGHO2_02_FULL_48_10b]|uniref:dTDP-4-dehydrorhamnose 3,5-epimerase n=1 Tax=Candidatus Wolfebacteria bacterium RIFCSPLOWO2_01_FULL_47_17b TaxID=1802558 RepID=A0A1F8DYP5_9BACT|nr:MAG: dTDP-4-dehydrorhamnose 3,5-epimerase [Candidatus Wolfebacteria bacterium RIFCSPLOWO2_01_FULL_47_17b]OHB21843.1 MAG: dTDP-4-dehydrorhamnose 3,5-epimerase [Parcubacteria group bacterium RIFCSPHIGHO2_02_FULL_48_10b]
MKFIKTKIDGVYVIEYEVWKDERGYFDRLFCKDELAKSGIQFDIVQINHSFSKYKGTLRGLHFQKEPKAQDKMAKCLRGALYDVAVDLRKDSPTYGQWIAEELSEENKKMLLVPKGCAHGFQTLTDNCEVIYFMSEFYSPEHSFGIPWDDPLLGIEWPILNPILSEKDKNWKQFDSPKA